MTPTPDPFSSDPYPSVPPPIPPGANARSSFIGAIFGPVMLLTIGVLFAIDYGGGPNVGQTWPAFIIVAGLLKLGEFMGVRNS